MILHLCDPVSVPCPLIEVPQTAHFAAHDAAKGTLEQDHVVSVAYSVSERASTFSAIKAVVYEFSCSLLCSCNDANPIIAIQVDTVKKDFFLMILFL